MKSIMRNLVCKSRKKDEVESDATRQRDETEKGEGGNGGWGRLARERVAL